MSVLLAGGGSSGAGSTVMANIPTTVTSDSVLFTESFEDTNFASRDWYDNTSMAITSDESHEGDYSLDISWDQYGVYPNYGGPTRHLFTATESVYVSYWIKFSSNWVGSGVSYHPHLLYLVTDADSAWIGPGYTQLTAYLEHRYSSGNIAIIGTQDSANIDEENIGADLVGVTEYRSVSGCNGDGDGDPNVGTLSFTDCYLSGNYRNFREWHDNSGAHAVDTSWHHVEAYFEMNSISGGIGQADGIVKYWYDGALTFDHDSAVLRTGEHPNMRWNQLIIGPYIEVGSPVAQTIWLDSLTVATTGGGSATSLTDISRDAGSASGGVSVTLTGTGFNGSPTVTFGSTEATNVVVQNSTTITCNVPAHAVGTVNVSVGNQTLQNAFEYLPAIGTTIVSHNFDDNTLGDFTAFGDCTVSTDYAYTGSRSCKCTHGASTGYAFIYPANIDVDSYSNGVYIRWYLYLPKATVDNVQGSYEQIKLLLFRLTSGDGQPGWIMMGIGSAFGCSGNTRRAKSNIDNGIINIDGGCDSPQPEDQWVEIQIWNKWLGSQGRCRCWINGTERYDVTHSNLGSDASNYRWQIGIAYTESPSGTVTAYVDNCTAADGFIDPP